MSLVQRGKTPQQVVVDGTLLDAQAANTNGVWFNIDRIVPWSLTLRGTFSGATVNILVSNQVVRPLDTDNLQAPFQSFTAPGSGGSVLPNRWIKAQVTGMGGGGSITVDLIGGA
jgi:hypothetical protein